MLGVLRHHIAELTRDNQALRYTLGLGSASSSGATLAPDSEPSAAEGDRGKGKAKSVPTGTGVDLEAVVQRVKMLIKENEELGDLVVEVGQGSAEEWERALTDSKAVITSLEYVRPPGSRHAQ